MNCRFSSCNFLKHGSRKFLCSFCNSTPLFTVNISICPMNMIVIRLSLSSWWRWTVIGLKSIHGRDSDHMVFWAGISLWWWLWYVRDGAPEHCYLHSCSIILHQLVFCISLLIIINIACQFHENLLITFNWSWTPSLWAHLQILLTITDSCVSNSHNCYSIPVAQSKQIIFDPNLLNKCNYFSCLY